MNEVVHVIGAIGGGVAVLAGLIAAVLRFRDEKTEQGIGLLVLAPVAYFVVYGLIYVVLVLAVIGFVGWVFVNWVNQ